MGQGRSSPVAWAAAGEGSHPNAATTAATERTSINGEDRRRCEGLLLREEEEQERDERGVGKGQGEAEQGGWDGRGEGGRGPAENARRAARGIARDTHNPFCR